MTRLEYRQVHPQMEDLLPSIIVLNLEHVKNSLRFCSLLIFSPDVRSNEISEFQDVKNIQSL